MTSYQFLTQRRVVHDNCIIAFDITQHKPVIRELVKQGIEKHNDYYLVKISLPKRPRTTGEGSQNHCLNGWIQIFCAETGNDFHTVKMYVKKKAISRGYRIKQDEEGNDMYDIYGDPIPISEADSSIEECGYLIEEMDQLAAEYGIILPKEIM